MADERLKLRELGVRVEAMFEWPAHSGNAADQYSLPDAAAEISERLQALERRLSPGPVESESARVGTETAPQLPTGREPSTSTGHPQGDAASAAIVERLRALDERLAGLHSAEETRLIEERLGAIESLVATRATDGQDLEEIAAHVNALTVRVNEIGPATAKMIEGLDHLRAIDERLSSQHGDEESRALEERVGSVERSLDRRDADDLALTGRLDHLEQLASVPAVPEGALEEIRTRLAALESAPRDAEIESLGGRVDRLEQAPPPGAEALEEILDRLGSLEGRIAAMQSADEGHAMEERLERLLAEHIEGSAVESKALQAAADRIEELARRIEEPNPAAEALGAIGERIEELARRIEEPNPAAQALGAVMVRLGEIERRLEEPAPLPLEIATLCERVEAIDARLEVERAEAEERARAAREAAEREIAAREAEETARLLAAAEHQMGMGTAPVAPGSGWYDTRSNSPSPAAPVGEPAPGFFAPAPSLPELGADPFGDLVRAAANSTDADEAEASLFAEDSVLELLRRDLAPLHDAYGPLTVAPDPVHAPLVEPVVEEPATAPGRRFKKLLR